MSLEPAIPTTAILSALKMTNGKVYLAAELLDCNPVTIYRRAKEEWSIKQAITREKGLLVDNAEKAIREAVLAGEPWAVIKVLESMGRKRGWAKQPIAQAVAMVGFDWDALGKELDKHDAIESRIQSNGKGNGDGH